ncbi:hypothetical protein R0K20_21930, partial [Staphylococcus sp. SIMBA_130]
APVQNAEEIAEAIIEVYKNESKNQQMGKNARKASYEFDFIRLTEKLIKIVESVNGRKELTNELVRKSG